MNETRLDPIPPLTCVAHDADEIDEILTRFANAGVAAPTSHSRTVWSALVVTSQRLSGLKATATTVSSCPSST